MRLFDFAQALADDRGDAQRSWRTVLEETQSEGSQGLPSEVSGIPFRTERCLASFGKHFEEHQVNLTHPRTLRRVNVTMRRYLLKSLLSWTLLIVCSATLTIKVPGNLPPLPASSRATLSTLGATFSASVTVRNDFVFHDTPSGNYDLSIACRDWAFERGLVIVAESPDDANPTERNKPSSFQVWRPMRGGWDKRALKGSDDAAEAIVDVRLLGGRAFYEERQGCESLVQ